MTQRLRGRDVLVLNWRDIEHPQAGGAEQYAHQIARQWVAQGVGVTWLTARAPGAARVALIDGIKVIRVGGPLTVYLHVAFRLLRRGRRYAAIIDCQNGIPFFSPALAGRRVPIVLVVHHVHQDQFSTRFSRPLAALGRLLEGPVSRRVYGQGVVVAVSASTREELRSRLGFRGPIFIVPNGAAAIPSSTGPRDPTPTITLVTRLVPHKRVDLLLSHLVATAQQIPELHVDIVGDGPELVRLRRMAVDLGLSTVVTFHGRQSDEVRDELVKRAWLTTSTSAREGWGSTLIEAARWGVPCLALDVPGIRDSVVHGQTGWLIGSPEHFGQALTDVVNQLSDGVFARRISAQCQEWACCFSWERSSELLASVVAGQIGLSRSRRQGAKEQRRYARSDIAAVASCAGAQVAAEGRQLRATDQIRVVRGRTSLLLDGCDEFDALDVLNRLGIVGAQVRLADRYDLLAGPQGFPVPPASTPHHAWSEPA